MLETLLRILGRSRVAESSAPGPDRVPGDGWVCVGADRFDLSQGARVHEGIHHPDWSRVRAWIDTLQADVQAPAWLACERSWIKRLLGDLGPSYAKWESEQSILLSPGSDRECRLALAYLDRTFNRVQRLLDGLAQPADAGKEILIVFEDSELYYRYVSAFDSPDSEHAISSGMFLSAGCGHFISNTARIDSMEPVIVHEMTHSLLSHLNIPAWLNEGMAVNTEERFGHAHTTVYVQQELMQKHRKHWNAATLPDFWTGQSFFATDHAQELSYDLARIMVVALASRWQEFKQFVLAADAQDAGRSAAEQVLGVDLDEFVRLVTTAG